jgi:tetratricopeptide (TPR) repeat protein
MDVAATITAAPAEVPQGLLIELRQSLAGRRIQAGFSRLRECSALIESLRPEARGAAELIGLLAQWSDLGYHGKVDVGTLLDRFTPDIRTKLPVLDYVHLRLAEALIALQAEETEPALAHLRFIQLFERDLPDKALPAVASFWAGRCFRMQGRYDEAAQATQHGVLLIDKPGYEPMAAVMRVLDSWLLFQRGRSNEAARVLNEAERVLQGTDDYVQLGNIYSAYGRIARREGKYELAVDYSQKAIEFYRRRDSQHPNLARCLSNLAFAERLMAQQMRTKIDSDAERRRSGDSRVISDGRDRQRLNTLRDLALQHLREAEEIYRTSHQRHGLGNVHSIRGSLYYDCDQLDQAEREALEAYELGKERGDAILMARGRILECMVQNARAEEGIEGEDPHANARRAQECAMEAIECANRTQNSRLKARAYVWMGLTLSNDLLQNVDGAREFSDKASALVKPGAQDYVWEDLQRLRSRVLSAGSVDTRLREWSQGEVRDCTFQQLEEQFAEIVIPKVWEREGRKVSRVADRLKISPKKVRRILSNLGLLSGRAAENGFDESEGAD